MVLWEVTLATAYFLGLQRTYKYALRIQRRVVGPNRPEIRRFLHRSRFDGAYCGNVSAPNSKPLKVHQSIQQRDIEVGRNLGDWILRWLDHVQPSAQIRVQPRMLQSSPSHSLVNAASSVRSSVIRRPIFRIAEHVKRGRTFFTPWNLRMRTYPSIGMMLRPLRRAGLNGQYRHLTSDTPNFPALDYRTGRHEGVFRKDIAQWMQRNLGDL